jgi:DNA-binding transcriptional LysR family regulator
LKLTQPAISKQIRQLETAAGMPLFERSGRKVSLTEAGRKLLVCASGIDELLHEAEQLMDGLRGRRTGTLRLSAVSTAKYFAPSLVAAFNAEHPDVTVRYTVDSMSEIARMLSGNEVDLVISGRPVPGIDAHAEAFAKHPYVIIAPPGHPLAGKRKIAARQLGKERFLVREPGSGTRMLMTRFFKQNRARYDSIMESHSNETIKQAVMAGMGISFLSMHTASLELTTRRLIALDVVGTPVLNDWYLIYARDKRLSPVALAFRDLLLKRAASIIAGATGIPAAKPARQRPAARRGAVPMPATV